MKFTEAQLDNLTKFLKSVGEDELTAYLLFILDNNIDVNQKKIKEFMLKFKDELSTVRRINKGGQR